jgi:hypothetical protein
VCRTGYSFSYITTQLDQTHQQQLAGRLQAKVDSANAATVQAADTRALFDLLAARAGGELAPNAVSYLVANGSASKQLPSLLDVSRSIGHRFETRVSAVPFVHPLESLLAVLQCHFAASDHERWNAIRSHPSEGAAGFMARRQAALEQLQQEVRSHPVLQQHRQNYARSGATLKLAVEALCSEFDCTLMLCVSQSGEEQQRQGQFAFGAELKDHVLKIGEGSRTVCAASFGFCEFALLGDCSAAERERWKVLVAKDNPGTREAASLMIMMMIACATRSLIRRVV